MNYESNLAYHQAHRAIILELKGVFYSMPDTKPVLDLAPFRVKKAHRLIINLSNVHLVTSVGIRCLILFKDMGEKEGLKYYLLCGNPSIYTNLADLSLHGLFSIIRDLRELPVITAQ
jgi:hypothetical protein